jgi:hypothetical protein
LGLPKSILENKGNKKVLIIVFSKNASPKIFNYGKIKVGVSDEESWHLNFRQRFKYGITPFEYEGEGFSL